jgi:magnesium transporter
MKRITDHILTLQHSLVYYERMLSDWSSIYISQLRAEISITKNQADVNLLYLTTVAACCQTSMIVIGRLTELYTNLLDFDSFPQAYSL